MRRTDQFARHKKHLARFKPLKKRISLVEFACQASAAFNR